MPRAFAVGCAATGGVKASLFASPTREDADVGSNVVACPPEAAPGGTMGVCLRPSMTMAEAGRAIVAFHFSRMLQAEPGTVDGRDPEALHDMRVSTRRLRAAFRVFRPAFAPDALASLDAEVRWLAGLLGRVRDLDVLADAVSDYDRGSGKERRRPLAWVLAEVCSARASERLVLLEALSSQRYLALKNATSRFLDGGASATVADGAPGLREQAEAAIREQLRRVRKAGKAAHVGSAAILSNDERLHALRIAAKRLRYTMEFFRDLFPPELQTAIAAATSVQDHLGAARDAQLQAAWLAKVAGREKHTTAELRALRGLVRHLRRREREALQAFAPAYEALAAKESRSRLRALVRPAQQPGAGAGTADARAASER